jgi:hypothetical protein
MNSPVLRSRAAAARAAKLGCPGLAGIGVRVGVAVGVDVLVGVGVTVEVGVTVGVAVLVGMGVAVGTWVGVADCVGVDTEATATADASRVGSGAIGCPEATEQDATMPTRRSSAEARPSPLAKSVEPAGVLRPELALRARR